MTEPAAQLEPLEPMHDSLFAVCESFDLLTTTATPATTTPDHTPAHPEPQTP